MLKRVVFAAAATAVSSYGVALAYTYAPMAAMQTMVIHASGSVTGVHACGALTSSPPATVTPPASSTPATSTPSTSSTSPASPAAAPLQALPTLVPASSQIGGADSGASTLGQATHGGIALSHGQSGYTGRGAVNVEIPDRKVIVALLNGGQISANRMSMGLYDALSIKNGKTVVAVSLARIAGMEFGEKELGRLAVTVNMVDGSVLTGNVYPGTVFEFEETGRVTATRAEEIASIRFPAE